VKGSLFAFLLAADFVLLFCLPNHVRGTTRTIGHSYQLFSHGAGGIPKQPEYLLLPPIGVFILSVLYD
jgi:hypothetical protein